MKQIVYIHYIEIGVVVGSHLNYDTLSIIFQVAKGAYGGTITTSSEAKNHVTK